VLLSPIGTGHSRGTRDAQLSLRRISASLRRFGDHECRASSPEWGGREKASPRAQSVRRGRPDPRHPLLQDAIRGGSVILHEVAPHYSETHALSLNLAIPISPRLSRDDIGATTCQSPYAVRNMFPGPCVACGGNTRQGGCALLDSRSCRVTNGLRARLIASIGKGRPCRHTDSALFVDRRSAESLQAPKHVTRIHQFPVAQVTPLANAAERARGNLPQLAR